METDLKDDGSTTNSTSKNIIINNLTTKNNSSKDWNDTVDFYQEEGEILESEGEEVEISKKNFVEKNEEINIKKDEDVNLKLFVKKSSLLKRNSVILVKSEGISIGRDRNFDKFRLRLKELQVSKFHSTIFRVLNKQNLKFEYQITDLGSLHGTFLNLKRLSEPKV
ncbi:hypothetical protein HK099_004983 [Clydaea vesicula]|uniref:FHA domain-containing protein n=1 Tax=Clydaea vesicula TaxID=447962 RepID=A0AAD5U6T9_9FUNG|nr:hypothetical protein HK099_004983 [Clydaea vesicula]